MFCPMAFTWFNAGLSQTCLSPRHCPRGESQVVKRLLLSGQFLWCQPNSSTLSLFCWSFGQFSEKSLSGCSVCQDGMALVVGCIAIYLLTCLSNLYRGHTLFYLSLTSLRKCVRSTMKGSGKWNVHEIHWNVFFQAIFSCFHFSFYQIAFSIRPYLITR